MQAITNTSATAKVATSWVFASFSKSDFFLYPPIWQSPISGTPWPTRTAYCLLSDKHFSDWTISGPWKDTPCQSQASYTIFETGVQINFFNISENTKSSYEPADSCSLCPRLSLSLSQSWASPIKHISQDRILLLSLEDNSWKCQPYSDINNLERDLARESIPNIVASVRISGRRSTTICQPVMQKSLVFNLNKPGPALEACRNGARWEFQAE